MRVIRIAGPLLLVAVVAAAAPPELPADLEFRFPAQLSGFAHLDGGAWLVAYFNETTASDGWLFLPEGAAYTNTTFDTNVDVHSLAEVEGTRLPPSEASWDEGATDNVHLAWGKKGPGHILVHARTIEFAANSPALQMQGWDQGTYLGGRGPEGLQRLRAYWESSLSADLAGIEIPSGLSDFVIVAQDIDAIHWSGAFIECDQFTSHCPDGGGLRTASESLGFLGTVEHGAYSYETAIPYSGPGIQAGLTLRDPAAYIVMAGPSLSASINGTLRLALAAGTCETCPDGETLTTNGEVQLAELENLGQGRGHVRMLAADATFKVDEEDASFSPVAITAGVAGLALAIVAAKVVAGLFVTHRRDHPRREAILAFLAQNPGAGLREIGRATEIPTGTIAHHMGSLLRSGKVTETKHGNVRRFFLADDRLAELDAAVALRDADLRSLVEHLVRAGPSTQGALVPPGVALSSVQSRLDRLVRIGLVASTRSGRFRHYEATPLAAALLSGNRVGEAASKDHVHPTAAYA